MKPGIPQRNTLLSLVIGAVAVALACGESSTGPSGGTSGPPPGLAACTGNSLLTRSPVAFSALREIVPLGNLNPTGHVLPTDHLYLGVAGGSGPAVPVDVVAPGSIVVSNVARQTRSGGSLPPGTDYVVNFFPCADVMFFFFHIETLTPELLAQVGSFDAGCNASYVTGGVTYQQCYRAVSIALSPGTKIGTIGGTGNGIFDLGGYDRRTPTLAFVDPGRTQGASGEFSANHTICPIDYFVSPVADPMRALLGGRGQRRTVAPLCGQVMQDIAGTAQGRWYFGTATMEDPHLALVHDNIDPTVGVFSVGTSIASLPSGVYSFMPAASGPVNADFSRVTADGATYCYESPTQWSRHILVQLTSSGALQIGAVSGATCGAAPSAWILTGIATTFAR